MLEFISVDVGGGGVIVVINILYCLLVCTFSHIFFPFFSPFLLTFGSWPLLIHVFLVLLR